MTEGKWYEPETDVDESVDVSAEREPGAATGVHKNESGQVDQVTYPDGHTATITYTGTDKNAQVKEIKLSTGQTYQNTYGNLKVLDDGSLVVGDDQEGFVLAPDGTTYGVVKNPDGTTNQRVFVNGKADNGGARVSADGVASISYGNDLHATEANFGATSWKPVNGQWTEVDNQTGQPTGRTAKDAPTYDSEGNFIVQTSDGGKETHTAEGATVVSDKDGKVTQVYYNDGSSRKFGYDDKGNVNSVTERDGSVWTLDATTGTWSDGNGNKTNSQVVVLANGNMMVTSADGHTWEVRTADAPVPTKVLDK